jgi:RimJ/RimL family protein N-acetyltransferase
LKILETERLVLRWLSTDDAEFILELLNDPAWLRFIGDKGIRTIEAARSYISNVLVEMYDRLGFGLYLTELKQGGVPIGICGLIKRDSLEDVDVGFAFLPDFRRQGYAREATAAVLEHGRRVLGFNRIVAITSPDNHASASLLEKLGFEFEKTVRLSDDGQPVRLFASNPAGEKTNRD